MTASLMSMGMLSELHSYKLAPNEHLLDTKGNARRALWLWTGPKEPLP